MPPSCFNQHEGYWSVSLSNAYQKDLNNLIVYDRQNQTVEITVVASLNRSVNATTTTGNDHPVPHCFWPLTILSLPKEFDNSSPAILPPNATLPQ